MRTLPIVLLLSVATIACHPTYQARVEAYGFSPLECTEITKALESCRSDFCFAKGGVGIIRNKLYVVTRGKLNELILPNNNKWVGDNIDVAQLIFVRDGSVIDSKPLTGQFNFRDTTAFLFQSDRIVFYEFKHAKGGAYERSPD